MNKDQENALLDKSINGDEEAFRQLLHEEKLKLITKWPEKGNNKLFSNISPEDFDDCWQVASVKAFRKLNTFKRACRFSTWFYRILMNVIYTLMISNNKKYYHEISVHNIFTHVQDKDYDYKDFDKMLVNEPTYSSNPFEDLAKKEDAIYYKSLIGQCLDKETLKILDMNINDNLSYKEIGQLLNISPSTIGSKLFYAKKSAKNKLGKLRSSN